MSIFGSRFINYREKPIMEDSTHDEYYYRVLLEKPQGHKFPVSSNMWESEREALIFDLVEFAPEYVERDAKDFESLIIKDATFLNKMIYLCKIEKPYRMNVPYTKIDDYERDFVKNILNKYNVTFRVKMKNSVLAASRGRVVNLAWNSMKNSLNKTEFTKKCVSYEFKTDDGAYSRFVEKVNNSLLFATYSVYKGVPNPKYNKEKIDQFYNELKEAINNANNDIIGNGFILKMTGGWDIGSIVLESLSSVFGESVILIDEAPGDLKIDGKEVGDDDEDEKPEDNKDDTPADDEEADYRIPDDAGEAEDEAPAEDTDDRTDVDQDGNPDDGGEEKETPDEPENEYRIPDDAGEAEDDTVEVQSDDTGDEDDRTDVDQDGNPDDGDDTTEEGDEPADDGGEADYRVPDDAGEAEDTGEETSDTDEDSGDDRTDVDQDGNPDDGDDTSDLDQEDNNEDEQSLKSQEDEIFNDMTPEQRRIQDEELKENYIKLYNTIGEISTRLETISNTGSNRSQLAFIQNQLNELKDYVYFYLSNVYSSKTYLENNINYEQYLVILANINTLIMQLNTKSSDID